MKVSADSTNTLRLIGNPTCIATICLILAGCGGKAPTEPTAPAVISVVVSSSIDLLQIGDTRSLGLTATLADGSTRSVQGNWSSDHPTIADVTPTGLITARGPGETNVHAEYEGLRITRRLRIVPSYQGTWSIEFRSMACEESEDWLGNGCEHQDPTQLYRTQLVVQQDRAAITAQIKPYTDIPSVPLTGQISLDGRLTASGIVPYTIPGCTRSCQFEIVDLNVLSTDNFQLTGHFTIRVSSPVLQGSRSWLSELLGSRLSFAATHSSGGEALVPAPSAAP